MSRIGFALFGPGVAVGYAMPEAHGAAGDAPAARAAPTGQGRVNGLASRVWSRPGMLRSCPLGVASGASLRATSPGVHGMTLDHALGELMIRTRGEGFADVTGELDRWLAAEGAEDGLLTVLLRHTSASLVIQENADPEVLLDLRDAFRRLAPRDHRYRHDAEGPDDMPAHIRAALTAATLSIPVRKGRMALGTWQAVYVAEHRAAAQDRRLALHFIGTRASGPA